MLVNECIKQGYNALNAVFPDGRLTETVEGLQTQVEELQRDMQKLKLVSAEQTRSRDRDSVQGLTCCRENCQLHK